MKPTLKTLTLTIALLVGSVSFSHAEWTLVNENTDGDAFYVDFERIKKHDGFVYYWGLDNFLKPDEWGNLSSIKYTQVDCNLMRRKILSGYTYKEQMSRGNSSSIYSPKNPQWVYAIPDSSIEYILKTVCSK